MVETVVQNISAISLVSSSVSFVGISQKAKAAPIVSHVGPGGVDFTNSHFVSYRDIEKSLEMTAGASSRDK
ncbi:hypothetical protein ABFY48_24850 [Lysinibacillus pakistanensis]|uniref:hypothetical protein n=1 Tax=Lysinibacillus pakistanensis TaxID=759811 RepID=UPI003D288A53